MNGGKEAFEEKLSSFSQELSKLSNQQSEADYRFQAHLQPMTSIHLESDLLDEYERNGKLENVYILAAIAVVILIITCFNYINLTNAINSNRSKEVFIRRIHGASYKNAIAQHISESIALNLAGFAIAFCFLVVFIEWIGPYLEFPYLQVDWSNRLLYYTMFGIFIGALVLSGIIPAILVSFGNISQFSTRTSNTQKVNSGFTRNIAFIQFIISCTLISGALVVLKQIKFMRDGDPGFSDTGVVALEINALNYHQNKVHFENVKRGLEALSTVEKISFSSCLPGEALINTSIRLTAEPVDNTKNCDVQVITSDYFNVYEIEMAEGRMFSEANPGDSLVVVVNESLANKLSKDGVRGILNNQVTVDWARKSVQFTVIGVVEDYHHYSKKQDIPPMLFLPLRSTFAVFRISVKNTDHALWSVNESAVQKVLKEHLTEPYSRRGIQVAFDVVNVESSYNKQYGGEEQFAKFLNVLTSLAIAMAGVGFFSLASATTRKRTREIAIRKVYGAQASDMSILLSSYFLKLAGLALLISLPLSYYLTRSWLSQFSTKVAIGSWFVLWPIVITVGLTVVSISYFILKLVFVKPTHHLRND